MTNTETSSNQTRFSGILVHPTSFPSPYGIGDFGSGAFAFIDYLADCGQTIWQTLPLGPTGFGDSPYQSFSAFAGQPLLISPDLLIDEGLLTKDDIFFPVGLKEKSVDYGVVIPFKHALYHIAYRRFLSGQNPSMQEDYNIFCQEEAPWLDDYAFFMACKDAHNGKRWLEWTKELIAPTVEVRAKWEATLSQEIGYYKFTQFLFFRQWRALKQYANQKGIRIVGDIPIFVSLDSVDVWANKTQFDLNASGYPINVAGVPPDYFSETGQLWGNPLYNWDVMEADGFSWWIKRVAGQLKMVDIIRIDHFRGLESYWAVPAKEKTAINGTWKKAPGRALLKALRNAFGNDLPIWAEDLGVITKEVEQLRDDFALPGMRILQFGFDDDVDSIMLPHNHIQNCICYPGTHDNDTAVGWYETASKQTQKKARYYMNTGAADIGWAFIRTALASVAAFAIIPMQDIIGLGSEARMNTPGQAGNNWAWRYRAKDLDKEWGDYLRRLTKIYNR